MILAWGGWLLVGGVIAGCVAYLAWLTVRDMDDAGWL